MAAKLKTTFLLFNTYCSTVFCTIGCHLFLREILASYPAKIFAVTVSPIQKGARWLRVLPFTALMLTTIVKKSVIIISATVAEPVPWEDCTASNAAPVALANASFVVTAFIKKGNCGKGKFNVSALSSVLRLSHVKSQILIEKLRHILWRGWQQSLHLTFVTAHTAPGASAPFLRWSKHTQTQLDWSDHHWKTRSNVSNQACIVQFWFEMNGYILFSPIKQVKNFNTLKIYIFFIKY